MSVQWILDTLGQRPDGRLVIPEIISAHFRFLLVIFRPNCAKLTAQLIVPLDDNARSLHQLSSLQLLV